MWRHSWFAALNCDSFCTIPNCRAARIDFIHSFEKENWEWFNQTHRTSSVCSCHGWFEIEHCDKLELRELWTAAAAAQSENEPNKGNESEQKEEKKSAANLTCWTSRIHLLCSGWIRGELVKFEKFLGRVLQNPERMLAFFVSESTSSTENYTMESFGNALTWNHRKNKIEK